MHNSSALQRAGVGLHYPGFSATQGGEALLQAWQQEPGYWQDYRARATAFLSRLAPHHPANVTAFMQRLHAPVETAP